MPSDSESPGTPQHWLARARGHLAIARQPKPAGACWEDLAYHARQSAALGLEAGYQERGLVFRVIVDGGSTSGHRAFNIVVA